MTPFGREGKLKALSIPHTGMAVTIDMGDSKNIHAKNKQEARRHLAIWALGDVYGRKGATSGPLPAGCKVQDGRVIAFSHR